jgi:hypothetical protein
VLGFALETFLDPTPPLRIRDVHELRAHRTAIDATRFLSPLIVDLKVRMRLGRQQPQRIKFRFEVSPLAEQVKNPFSFKVFYGFGGSAALSLALC